MVCDSEVSAAVEYTLVVSLSFLWIALETALALASGAPCSGSAKTKDTLAGAVFFEVDIERQLIGLRDKLREERVEDARRVVLMVVLPETCKCHVLVYHCGVWEQITRCSVPRK